MFVQHHWMHLLYFGLSTWNENVRFHVWKLKIPKFSFFGHAVLAQKFDFYVKDSIAYCMETTESNDKYNKLLNWIAEYKVEEFSKMIHFSIAVLKRQQFNSKLYIYKINTSYTAVYMSVYVTNVQNCRPYEF